MPKKIPKFKMIARSLELYKTLLRLLKDNSLEILAEDGQLKLFVPDGEDEYLPSGKMFFTFEEISGTIIKRKDGSCYVDAIVDFWNEDTPFTFNLSDEDMEVFMYYANQLGYTN